jgi:hypothetical protein
LLDKRTHIINTVCMYSINDVRGALPPPAAGLGHARKS